MSPQARVFLYGKSLILDALTASLRRRPDVELVQYSPELPNMEALHKLAPDVLLFDIANVPADAMLSLLKTCPELTLIGVDPENSQFILWSARCEYAASTQDLVQAIQSTVRSYPPDPNQGVIK